MEKSDMHSELVDEDDADWEHLLNLKIFHESVCLISTNRNLTLKIEEDAVRELESIDKEVNVVAITGLYRTGKSVLLNQLARRNDGGSPVFGVGHATTAMTTGIWATCMRHPEFKDQVLMLLDTEGLGDIKKGDQQHDNKIFTIATLLSSTLIYNIMGPFNQDALEKLTFIAQMSDNVVLSGKPENEDTIIESAFPAFVLCMRDFFLDIQTKVGEIMTLNEYLEDCLLIKRSGDDLSDARYNALRRAIRRYFKRRHCFRFPLPTAKLDDLKSLDKTSTVTFSDEFQADLTKFTTFIHKCKPKLMLNGQKTTGKALASMARTYVQCISEGNVPCVGDAMMCVADKRNQKLIGDAVKSFTSKIQTISIPEPNLEAFEVHFKKNLDEEITGFKDAIIFDEKNLCLMELKTKLEHEWRRAVVHNKSILFQNGTDKLEKLHEQISKDVDRGIFTHKEGYSAYKDALRRRDAHFNTLPEIYGMQKPDIIREFDRVKSAEGKKVQADANAERKQSELEGEVQKLNKQVKELESHLNKQEENVKASLDDMSRKYDAKDKELKNQKASLDNMSRKYDAKDKELKNLQASLDLMNIKNDSRDKKLKDLKASLDDMNKKCDAKDKEFSDLKASLDYMNRKDDAKDKELMDLKISMNLLERNNTDNSNLKVEIQRLKNEYEQETKSTKAIIDMVGSRSNCNIM